MALGIVPIAKAPTVASPVANPLSFCFSLCVSSLWLVSLYPSLPLSLPLSLWCALLPASSPVRFTRITTSRIPSCQTYWVEKEKVLVSERVILHTMAFDLCIQHPYDFVVGQVTRLKGNKDMLQLAWNFINDSYRTTECLRFKSQAVSCASLYLAWLACLHTAASAAAAAAAPPPAAASASRASRRGRCSGRGTS